MQSRGRDASIGAAVAGAILIAALSTVGDLIWFGFELRHRAIYGLAHGALLFLGIGLYLGARQGRSAAGAAGGAAVGLLAAGAYYGLAPLTGRAVMFAIWMGVWVLIAALAERLAGPVVRWRPALARGGLAAICSGLAFYAISGIWFGRPAGGRNYAVHFASWTVAYLPAFLALLVRRPQKR